MFLYNLLKPVREDGLLAFLGRQGVMFSSQGHNIVSLRGKHKREVRGNGIILSADRRGSCLGRGQDLPSSHPQQ